MLCVIESWQIVLITDKIDAQSVNLNLSKHFDDGTPVCLWKHINPVEPSDEQKSLFDYVFSDSNELLRSIANDTLFVINNQEDMKKIQGTDIYLNIPVDWDNQCLIGGKTVTSSISDEIISQQLLECTGTTYYTSYQYAVEIRKCIECYDAIEHHYFWAIYDKKPDSKDVLLTIQTY
jgi:hypothetical protein